MSRRTSDSNKAILAAWNREQELVKEGKGTREWTPEEQQDILEKGKAYDENGKAFEGQHMKSAEQYPEYQGEPGNIQFLTRTEHLEAHNGNWQNPTNWYFDPVTKEKVDFGEGPYIECDVIQLSEPVANPELKTEQGTEKLARQSQDAVSDIKEEKSGMRYNFENAPEIKPGTQQPTTQVQNTNYDPGWDELKDMKFDQQAAEQARQEASTDYVGISDNAEYETSQQSNDYVGIEASSETEMSADNSVSMESSTQEVGSSGVSAEIGMDVS